ncbi:MAG: hypothetical protein MI976_21620 [Pseudomonadales bacterium]|nr:hypothetical protein [Pseudomonadales bacterium]
MKEMLRVGLVSFLLVAVVFALTVSPKMMEKRRADSALEETVEQMPM